MIVCPSMTYALPRNTRLRAGARPYLPNLHPVTAERLKRTADRPQRPRDLQAYGPPAHRRAGWPSWRRRRGGSSGRVRTTGQGPGSRRPGLPTHAWDHPPGRGMLQRVTRVRGERRLRGWAGGAAGRHGAGLASGGGHRRRRPRSRRDRERRRGARPWVGAQRGPGRPGRRSRGPAPAGATAALSGPAGPAGRQDHGPWPPPERSGLGGGVVRQHHRRGGSGGEFPRAPGNLTPTLTPPAGGGKSVAPGYDATSGSAGKDVSVQPRERLPSTNRSGRGWISSLPEAIAKGTRDVSQRGGWNRPAAAEFALSTETWREHVGRRQRCLEV